MKISDIRNILLDRCNIVYEKPNTERIFYGSMNDFDDYRRDFFVAPKKEENIEDFISWMKRIVKWSSFEFAYDPMYLGSAYFHEIKKGFRKGFIVVVFPTEELAREYVSFEKNEHNRVENFYQEREFEKIKQPAIRRRCSHRF